MARVIFLATKSATRVLWFQAHVIDGRADDGTGIN